MAVSKKRRVRLWTVLFWLAVWQAGSMLLGQALLLASPVSALLRLAQLCITAAFWKTVGVSALRIFGGFLISCVLAVLCAAAAARLRWFRELLAPLVTVIKTVPVVSFIILALVWVSSRNLSLLISGLMVFPPVYLNVLEGIEGTDRQLLEMAWVFRVPFGRTLRGIYIPQVLPRFRAACSVALGLCWKAGTAAEVIGLPAWSVGEKLYTAKIYLQTPDLFAWTITVVCVSAAFEKLFLSGVDVLVRKAGEGK